MREPAEEGPLAAEPGFGPLSLRDVAGDQEKELLSVAGREPDGDLDRKSASVLAAMNAVEIEDVGARSALSPPSRATPSRG